MTAHRRTQWSRYPECPECGARSGSPCTGRNARRLTRPHRVRHAVGYMPNPGGRS